ncbi:hypothetical protein B5V88_17675 [Heyndrickxia sporothermodurans]|uniref:hypothetical protein n=1 Tax=Heyndrickxia sporothermodurans TaxID=46224 RepID=UPI000824959B|nr:hypothetical protein [Heyndrickxia sporothermodurans]MBL5833363.1 hypothetical protein [Heyndrickxia sporothermodurans]MBL5848310.1 hypothetical protein [Heyndrickxia sporothermodurans]MBL5868020.1 hypothetical protein [Heyndrickxia sporothermodurans]MBL5882060.1 hypothetical protein [Heyndrickxia sporothermodurans]PTY72818.1 hypothetical protein B5V88_17675 [Heyndrickxia sporothermodurans]
MKKVNLGRQSEGMKPKMPEESESWSSKKRNEAKMHEKRIHAGEQKKPSIIYSNQIKQIHAHNSNFPPTSRIIPPINIHSTLII